MKILMLTPYLPYPLFSGGQIRSYNIIKQLSSQHRITLFSLIRRDEEKEYVVELEKYCSKVTVFKRKKAFQLDNILLAGLTSWPFILHVYNHRGLKAELQKELKREKYDLIHVETFYMMHNLPKTDISVVLFEQNIEHDVYRRIAQYFQPALLRPLLLLDVAKIKKWEEHFWKEAKVLVVMSENDKKFVNRNAFVCGNGVDTEKFKIQSIRPFNMFRVALSKVEVRQAQDKRSKFKVQKKEKKILFIGSFKWYQNRDAVRWILKEIWPRIKRRWKMKDGKLILWIVGRSIPDSIKRLTSDPNIIFDENASEDTVVIFNQADVLLGPIRVGGGTSFKILEAMASGVPVVTTKLGISGIGGGDREKVLIGETAMELANATLKILTNQILRQNLIASARKFVEEKYDWKIITKQIESIYESVVKHPDV